MGSIIVIIAIVALFAIGRYLKSPEIKGRRSEQAIARKLDLNSHFKKDSKTLTNLYIPRESGGTTEIDVIYITHKGLLVLENKNYAGYIFGNEANKRWTVTLYAGKSWYGGKKIEKHQFYNPIWQNRTHIKHLKAYLKSEIKVFSLITFSNRGDLKDITVNSKDVYVCNHSELSGILYKIWSENPDTLSDSQIEAIYNKLLPLMNVDDIIKQTHVRKIHESFTDTDVCPLCGGKLVLRTAKKSSPNAGHQFYGCSNYPKCRYTRNL